MADRLAPDALLASLRVAPSANSLAAWIRTSAPYMHSRVTNSTDKMVPRVGFEPTLDVV